jgi:hypothetical protein
MLLLSPPPLVTPEVLAETRTAATEPRVAPASARDAARGQFVRALEKPAVRAAMATWTGTGLGRRRGCRVELEAELEAEAAK